MKKFILHWGEMGTSWGLNRTMAQIYAMLYLSPSPLTAEEISETLSIARSTVSTGLRELLGWGVVRTVHILGDRRDHFETMSDVWEMFRVILRERKRREIDPAMAILQKSVEEVRDDNQVDAHVCERLREMLEFFDVVMSVYEQAEELPTETLKKAAKTSDRLVKLLNKTIRS